MIKRIFFCIFLSAFIFQSRAQQGKDGSPAIATSTVVNVYTSAAANYTAGSNTISVSSAAGFTVGDLIYIIQMQGASINAGYDPFGDPTNSYLVDASKPYGQVLNYNNCGNNEYAQVNAVAGTTFTLDCSLQNNYDVSGKVQVIRVPRYNALTINSGGVITCPQWNGATGGVIAIEVKGNTTINTGGKIDASALGFRGANVHLVPSTFGPSNLGTTHWEYGAWKGEGIGGDTAFYRTLSGDFGIGAMANGGGGGIENNSGGGGGGNAGNVGRWKSYGVPDLSGANYATCWGLETPRIDTGHSSGGGRGGYTFSANNKDPRSVAPGNSGWGGDNRQNKGGEGGQPLDYSTGRLFLGGGGGAGDEDNGYSGPGGNGGGIIYLLSYGTVSGAGQVLSNGANGVSTFTTAVAGSSGQPRGKDGAGGAGAGGTIILKSEGNIALTNANPVTANGGKGGDQILNCATAASQDAYGPGGGGGGGYIAASNTVANITVSGGANGIYSQMGAFANTNLNLIKYFAPNGATKGDTGIKASVQPYYLTTTNFTTCVSAATSTLSVMLNGSIPTGASVMWYTASAGGNAVFTGNPYSISTPTTVGTYTYYAGTCPGTYRLPVVLTVQSAPTLSVSPTNTTVCAGTNVTFTATGATSYSWSPATNLSATTGSVVIANPSSSQVYTVTGSLGAGCTATQTIAVNITSPATLTVTATATSICTGNSATLTVSGGGPTYTWTPSTGLNATGGASVTASPSSPQTYTVSSGSGSCLSTGTVALAISPGPTISVVGDGTICPGGTATLTAGGALNYTWSPGTGLSATTGSTVTASPLISQGYTVTGADASGCISTATASVTIGANLTIAVTPSVTSICNGGSATLTASGASSYTWSPSTGLSSTTGGTVIASPSSSQTYIVTGANGVCSGTTTAIVNTGSNPVITASTQVVCPGITATLSANGASNYTWSPSAGLSASTGNSVTVASPVNNATYSVTGDNNGCVSNTVVVTLTVNPAAPITTNSLINVCSGDSATLSAGGGISYTWTPSAGLNSTTGSPVKAGFSNTTTTVSYTVTGTDNNGCTGSAITTISVSPSPTLTATSSAFNGNICMGYSDTLRVTGSATAYTWSPSATLNVSTGTVVIASPTVTTDYTVTGSLGSCSKEAVITVSVNPIPVVSVTVNPSNSTICAGSSATLSASSTQPGATFTWSPSAGLNSSSGMVVTATPTNTTDYTVTAFINSCYNQNTVHLIVNPVPSFSFTSATFNGNICIGYADTLSVAGLAGTSYTWSPAGSLSASSGTMVIASPTVNTTYTVNSELNGCSYVNTYSITVNPIPVVTVSVNPNGGNICPGKTATLTASSSVPGATFSWSPATGLNASTGSTVLASATNAYTVTALLNTCSNSNIISVNVYPQALISVSTPSVVMCTPSPVTLSAAGASSYTWQPSASLSAANSATVSAHPAANTVYTVSGTDANGCAAASNSVVVLYSPISAAISATPTEGDVPLEVHFTNSSTGGSSYSWIYGNGSFHTGTSVADTSTHTLYTSAGTYTVIMVTNGANGCQAKDSVFIVVTDAFAASVPNIFTPNDDGINDTFFVKGSGIKDVLINIYDRWGLKLWEGSSVNAAWDGKDATEGTYFYIVKITDTKNKTHEYKGPLMLMK